MMSSIATDCPRGYSFQPQFRSTTKIIQGPDQLGQSIRHCRNNCNDEQRCKAFGYKPDDKSCVLLTAVFSEDDDSNLNENLDSSYIFCANRK